jgi:hypothetical protein
VADTLVLPIDDSQCTQREQGTIFNAELYILKSIVEMRTLRWRRQVKKDINFWKAGRKDEITYGCYDEMVELIAIGTG